MMTVYEKWMQYPLEDPDLKQELESIRGQESEISDRFYQDLEFGTGGLRGVIGAGTNRMNLYTVRRATQGIANMLLEKRRRLLWPLAMTPGINPTYLPKR